MDHMGTTAWAACKKGRKMAARRGWVRLSWDSSRTGSVCTIWISISSGSSSKGKEADEEPSLARGEPRLLGPQSSKHEALTIDARRGSHSQIRPTGILSADQFPKAHSRRAHSPLEQFPLAPSCAHHPSTSWGGGRADRGGGLGKVR